MKGQESQSISAAEKWVGLEESHAACSGFVVCPKRCVVVLGFVLYDSSPLLPSLSWVRLGMTAYLQLHGGTEAAGWPFSYPGAPGGQGDTRMRRVVLLVRFTSRTHCAAADMVACLVNHK